MMCMYVQRGMEVARRFRTVASEKAPSMLCLSALLRAEHTRHWNLTAICFLPGGKNMQPQRSAIKSEFTLFMLWNPYFCGATFNVAGWYWCLQCNFEKKKILKNISILSTVVIILDYDLLWFYDFPLFMMIRERLFMFFTNFCIFWHFEEKYLLIKMQ